MIVVASVLSVAAAYTGVFALLRAAATSEVDERYWS